MFSLHDTIFLRRMDTWSFKDGSIIFIKFHHLIREKFTNIFTPNSLDTFPKLCINHFAKDYEAMTSINLTFNQVYPCRATKIITIVKKIMSPDGKRHIIATPYMTMYDIKTCNNFINLSEKGILVCFAFTHKSQCTLFASLPIESICYVYYWIHSLTSYAKS